MRTDSKGLSRTVWLVCVIYEHCAALLYATAIDVMCIIAVFSLCVLIARVFLCNALCIISLISDARWHSVL